MESYYTKYIDFIFYFQNYLNTIILLSKSSTLYLKTFLMSFCRLVKEKVQFVHEFWEQGKYVFIAPDTYDEKVMAKKWKDTIYKYQF